MSSYPQVGLPFLDGGFTQTLQQLLAYQEEMRARKRRVRSSAKPDLSDIDLSQPLLPHVVPDSAFNWQANKQDENGQEESVDTPKKVIVQGCFKQLPDTGRNDEFQDLRPEDIARLAAGLLHHDLEVLFNNRGNADVKRKIIDWLFATTYVHDCVEYHNKPMHLIPFTAQFCCAVEEIDHTLLCEAVNDRIEELRESQQAYRDLDIPNHETHVNYGNTHQDATPTLWS